MSTSSLQQDYHLSAVSYRLERLFELKSGEEFFTEASQLLDTLQAKHIYTLLQNPPFEELRLFCCLYLLVCHFQPFDLQSLEPSLLPLLTPFIQDFVPVLKTELEALLRQSKLYFYFFARHLLLREIQFLETVMDVFALKVSAQDVSRHFFLSQSTIYLGLLRCNHGSRSGLSSLLWQVLNDYGWCQRWQNATHIRHTLPPPRVPLKQEIACYTLSDTGKLLMASLEPHELLTPRFKELLHHYFDQNLKNITPTLNSELEHKLREITQVVMQLAIRKHPAVEKITALLLDTAFSYLPTNNYAARALILFTLVQEQVLGTQNLKYRLNDSTRGIALSMARLLKTYPEWNHTLDWAMRALLDGILEIYESFNLADNALRSFVEAFKQEQEQLTHQEWEQEKTNIKAFLQDKNLNQ